MITYIIQTEHISEKGEIILKIAAFEVRPDEKASFAVGPGNIMQRLQNTAKFRLWRIRI